MSAEAGNKKPQSKVMPQNAKAKKAFLPRKYLGNDFVCDADA
jgi:hypothetical protein